MMSNDPRARLAGASQRPATPISNLIGKIVTAIAGIAVLAVALMVSIVFFAVILTIGVLAGGYFWWKTRDLRKQMRERPPGGRVIEGEVVRDAHSPPGMRR